MNLAPALRRSALIVCTLALGACSQGHSGHGGKHDFAPTQVRLIRPQQEAMTHYQSFLGTVTPLQTVTLVPQTSGVLQKMYFQQGGLVQKGQLLFQIDPTQARLSLAQAQANLASARASARYSATVVAQDKPLVEKDFITRQSYDQAVSQAQAGAAAVQADEAAVQQAALTLSYTRITAPISGRISMALVKPGNLLVANATQLATINQLNPIGIDFQIPQNLLPAARRAKDQAWPVLIENEQGAEILDHGTIQIIDNGVSATTATVSVQAQAANAQNRLWPGQFVQVQLPVAQLQSALTLPVAAVQQGSSGNFVYLAPKGVVQSQPVQVLWEDANKAVVSGLAPNAQVIYPVPARIYPGVKVLLPKAGAAGSHPHRQPAADSAQ
ncbi:efflux RND transporter periplasmic adaptor subunit [Candidatus Igneacidithiobacillus taiwanensis]|uniref:efflux RND transporter periplasmic adaptor subunit n=1 Tax=Candidatus Igneacidithiobacillus taiwanensis TaxID=1945924 RepID=UPI002896C2D8|nr:efflux RND transporter periplasmic adaptor subunit [Candidatus Igneacidithiobacillus taiwanensis]MCE5360110.1 efflux RND transporter periplasmic adaptor subunit [Acidithiobacillus sp.]